MRTITILLLLLSSWTINAQDANQQTYLLRSLVTVSNVDLKPAVDFLRTSLPEGSSCMINNVKQNITIIDSAIDIPSLIDDLKVSGYRYALAKGPCDDLYKAEIQKEIYISEKPAEYRAAITPDYLIYTKAEFDHFSQLKQARIILSDNTKIK